MTRDSAVPSVCLITMGCAKNEVDSAAMARRLREAGFSVTEEASSADAIIVNTCSFIQAATEESIDAILEAASLPKVDEGSAALIVAGCMPARYGDDLAAELTEASAFVPCSREDDIAEVVARALGIPLPVAAVGGEPAEGEGRTFAYVKISDGCDRFCSYCTIPFIRGRYHSFPYEQIAGAPTFPTAATSHGSSTRWPRRTPTRGSASCTCSPRAQPTSCSPLWRPARTFALNWTFPCST